jgi:hypothetical protein
VGTFKQCVDVGPAAYQIGGMKNQGLKLAVEKAGGRVANLAKRLGLGAAAVYRWDRATIPLERMFQIERELGVPRELLRPELYKKEDTAAE